MELHRRADVCGWLQDKMSSAAHLLEGLWGTKLGRITEDNNLPDEPKDTDRQKISQRVPGGVMEGGDGWK